MSTLQTWWFVSDNAIGSNSVMWDQKQCEQSVCKTVCLQVQCCLSLHTENSLCIKQLWPQITSSNYDVHLLMASYDSCLKTEKWADKESTFSVWRSFGILVCIRKGKYICNWGGSFSAQLHNNVKKFIYFFCKYNFFFNLKCCFTLSQELSH